jgi:cystathionine beta-synthase
MSQEKLLHLRALGAQIVMTRSDVAKGHPQYYQDLAEKIARQTPGAYYINQFNNPANPEAHERTTGPEIWEQSGHKVDAMVCGVGSGGTITGLSRFFARVSPETEMVLADPVGSVLAEYTRTGKIGTAGSWLVEGIGEDFLPSIADLSRVKQAYSIPDAEAFVTVRALLKQECVFAGSSTGTLLAAALRYCREQTKPKTVVTLVCDTGSKYLSKVYNDFWLADQGLAGREKHGDLRDLISRPFREGAVVAVEPNDPLTVTYARMRLYDISQLAVMDEGKLVGIVDEGDLLLAVRKNDAAFDGPVRDVMSANVRTIDHRAGFEDLMGILEAGLVAVVSDADGFHGIITRIDVLNFLRKERNKRREP